MKEKDAKPILVPIEDELVRLIRLVSEKEQRTNPRLMKKMGKIRAKLLVLREVLTAASKRTKPEGAH